ncbi:MAG: MltR family transcriptional regulator [Candidatus Manganitrophus sp.]|nr:MltR family transcriptional regulator [Candidatus Manganitrophus sp.]MDC4222719.1 MltR family transcriptional regulator [Candidatus Manganitrophus sp.]WDT71143.1 MAG: MltR family transcriptional regulator [Candidatus Manganitrophus sp.]WDT81562.1 MAG: MltR family transcriptional regulator [Candidatus Manganitrophus sp.]
MTKRTLLPAESLSADTQAFFDVLNNEPDLSAVVISAAYIDACLAALLEKFFVASAVSAKVLDSRSGSLGSLSSRADACYVLGLVSKPLYQDLLVLAEMRNQFAHHHLSLSFASPELSESCSRLMYPVMLKNGNTDEPLYTPGQLRNPRDRFTMTVVLISQRLLLTALGTQKREPAV